MSFPASSTIPQVSSRAANPLAEHIAHGKVHNNSFPSTFEPINPAVRNRQGYRRNNIVRFQHWRHDDSPRPTLCVIHGFMGSPYLVNGLFFSSLPWFYKSGYDVPLYTLFFHGRRAGEILAVQRLWLFRPGMTGFAEAMGQAVYDFRTILNWLRDTGVGTHRPHRNLTGRLPRHWSPASTIDWRR